MTTEDRMIMLKEELLLTVETRKIIDEALTPVGDKIVDPQYADRLAEMLASALVKKYCRLPW